MRTYPIVYRRGFTAGRREAAGLPMAPCPYRQWPLSALRKYRVWVTGWHDGKYAEKPRRPYLER